MGHQHGLGPVRSILPVLSNLIPVSLESRVCDYQFGNGVVEEGEELDHTAGSRQVRRGNQACVSPELKFLTVAASGRERQPTALPDPRRMNFKTLPAPSLHPFSK